MKKILVIAVVIATFSVSLSAQKERGFGGQVETGYGFKLGTNDWNVFQVAVLPGFHFNPYLFAGVGVGYNYYTVDGFNMSSIPVFGHITANFVKGKTFTPFASAKLGYGIGSKQGLKTGLYGTVGVGVKYKICAQSALSLSLVWDQMEFRDDNDSDLKNALALRLGWEF